MSADKISYALAALLTYCSIVHAEEIYNAVARDDVKQVELLLEQHPELLNSRDTSGNTPLMIAASGGHKEAVACLLTKGADYKAVDGDKRTALHYAVRGMAFYLTSVGFPPEVYGSMRERYQQVILLLQAKGADINARDGSGATPLQSVAFEGEPGIGVMPERYTPGEVAQMTRSFSNRVDVADFLIAHGAEVDIFSAAGLNKTDSVSILLNRHPELINQFDHHGETPYGETPLHWAARLNRLEVATQLLERGAVVDAQGPYGMTPLGEAALAGNKRIVEVLLSGGADVNAPSGGNRRPPLHWAAGNDHSDVVELLLAHGADLEMRDGNGDTALLVVAASGDEFAVNLLLKHKAEVNVTSRYGWTPLLEAAALQKPAAPVIKALLAAGADVTAKNRQGKTALQYAEERKNEDIADLLRQHGAKE